MVPARIFGLLLVCLAADPASALVCPFQLLSEKASHQGEGVVREYFTRAFQTKDGPYYETLLIYESPGPGRFRTYSIRRQVRRGVPQSAPGVVLDAKSHPDSEAIHYSLIEPVVEANLRKYVERRLGDGQRKRGWPAPFIAQLRETTRKTINHSIYHWAVDPATGNIVSGVRFTLVPYAFKDGKPVADGPLIRSLFGPVQGYREEGKTHDDSGLPLPLLQVPDLAYLGIEVPRPAMFFEDLKGGNGVKSGLHIGIGGLFVDESLPQAERDLLNTDWMQAAAGLAHGTHDPRFNYYFLNFYFMLDPLSEKAYHPWKYSPIIEYTKDGKPVHVAPGEKTPKISFEGIDWLPVEWHPERIEEYLADLHEGKIPRKGPTTAERRDDDILFSGPLVPFPYTAETKSEIDSLFEKLASEPENAAGRIYEKLRRKIQLLDLHWNEEGRGDAATRDRAQHAYELAKKNLVDLESQIRRLAAHPRIEVRKKAFQLVGSLMEFPGREKDFLPVHTLVQELYPQWIIDESPAMRNATAYMLGTYPSLRKLFGKDRRAHSPAEALAILKEKGMTPDDLATLQTLLRETTAGRRNPQDLVHWLGQLGGLPDHRAVGTAVIDLTLAIGGD